MKLLVWLLLIINLLLLVYFNIDHILPRVSVAQTAEIAPENIKVLSQKEIEALPKKTASSAPPLVVANLDTTITLPNAPAAPTTPTAIATSCFEWGVFSANSLTNAQNAVTKLSLQATVKEQTSQQAKRFWVYKPPLKTAEEAQLKAAELKALGVTDIFVVLEPKWRNAISFGVFEDEQLANKLLNELKAKGVKDVVKALRNQGKGHSSLIFNNLAANQITALKQLKSEFPEAALKEVGCN